MSPMHKPPTTDSKGLQRTKIEIRHYNRTGTQNRKQQSNIDHRAFTSFRPDTARAIRSRRVCCMKR